MLIPKPKTDQSATFTLYANGTPCSEYTLPQRPAGPNAAEVFVAVPPDATLTLSGTISGTLVRCRIDLLADGSFVNNRVVKAGPGDGRQGLLHGRKVEFKNAYTVPHPTVHDRSKRAKVVEGDLIVQALPAATPHRLLDGRGANLGVGSIALVFSLCQVEGEKYGRDGEPSYPDHTLGGWRTALEDVCGSGIKPDFSLGMDVYKDANPISDKKANVFWRDYRNTRPGNAPWGTIVFYYRSLEAIQKAGCVPMTNGYALAPFAGRFINAEASSKKDERSAVTSRAGSASRGPQGLLSTPEPAEEAYSVKGKKRRIGQRLPLSRSGVTSSTASPSSPSNVASHLNPDTVPLLESLQPSTMQDPVTVPPQLPRATAPNVLSGALFDAFAKISAANAPSASAVPSSPAPSSLGKRPSYTSPSASISQTAPTAPMLPPPSPVYLILASPTSPVLPAFSVSAQTPSNTSSPAPPPEKRSRLADLQARKAALQAEIAAERERKASVLAAAETARQAREAAGAQREAEEREAIQREEAERVLREREEAEWVKAEAKRKEDERLAREKEKAERERLEEIEVERELEALRREAEGVREERMEAEAEIEIEGLEAERSGAGGLGGRVAVGELVDFGQSADGLSIGTAPLQAPLDANGGVGNGLGLVTGAVSPANPALDLELVGPEFGNMNGENFEFTEEQIEAAGQFQMTDEQIEEMDKEWTNVLNGLGHGNGVPE
ncbi:hypothetical protein B0A48_05789 [Cryoendolithus antarcticus]|uniref:Uncharacterized protein n=1 Tax=Cryoendolithus antarcticus TaxID=1507870 RepID=A0A1V8TBY6_9PEZI|nr:hypothetical protein B0A48_05789 [Cryoendolithus antarcticus]